MLHKNQYNQVRTGYWYEQENISREKWKMKSSPDNTIPADLSASSVPEAIIWKKHI